MGIQKFITYIKTEYPESITLVDKSTKTFDNIYFDMNYIIHLHYWSSQSEDILMNRIDEYILNLLKKYKPNYNVFYCFDGSAGDIKKATIVKRIATSEKLQLTSSRKNPISTNIFSHHSKFINDYIYTHLYELPYDDIGLSDNVNYNLILNDEFGEAEIKISREIQKQNKKYPNRSSLIISNDSDLILISICTNVSNIHIYNFQTISKIKTLINIDKIKKLFMNKYKTCIYDFVILSLIHGNDYFPKIKFIKFETVTKGYKQYIQNKILDYIMSLQINNVFDVLNNIKINHTVNGNFEYIIKDNKNVFTQKLIDYISITQLSKENIYTINFKNFQDLLNCITTFLPKQFKSVRLESTINVNNEKVKDIDKLNKKNNIIMSRHNKNMSEYNNVQYYIDCLNYCIKLYQTGLYLNEYDYDTHYNCQIYSTFPENKVKKYNYNQSIIYDNVKFIYYDYDINTSVRSYKYKGGQIHPLFFKYYKIS